MKKYILLPFLCLSLLACENRPRVTVQNTDESYEGDTSASPNDYKFDYSDVQLGHDFAYSTSHPFSHADTKDKFTFYIPEGFISQSKSVLVIQNAGGDTLFADTFRTSYLVDPNDMANIGADDEMIDYINEKAKNVLYDAPFIDPNRSYALELFGALKREEINDPETLDELKSQGRFLFRLIQMGNTNTFYGYSEKEGKVKLIYSNGM